jgi:hypothetical protein
MRSAFHWAWRRDGGLFHLAMLRAASLMVPGHQRAEWSREWRGELWHVRQSYASLVRGPRRGKYETTAFCLGAFQDALCVRRSGGRRHSPIARTEGTATKCLLTLSLLVIGSLALAMLLPGVRAVRRSWPREQVRNLVVIHREGSNASQPSISPAQFIAWQGRRQRYFDNMAFYRAERKETDMGSPSGNPSREWEVGRASLKLFALLGLRFDHATAKTTSDLPEVILGESMWKRQFGADPHVTGKIVRLGSRATRIAGVIEDESLSLPGGIDAWELSPDPVNGPGSNESSGPGYVVAHLTLLGAAEMAGHDVQISANAPDGEEEDFWGVAVERWCPAPLNVFLFGLLLALLALPAITSVSLGEYSANSPKTSWKRKMFRWSFLSAKIALLLPILYFLSLDMGYGCTLVGRNGSVYLQLSSCFALALFTLRWVLKDQRQRCPVCLRRVVHPAQVGQASKTFLDWNGTEMMCAGGHTLLHVPSLPTSWFGTQRWLYLDTSWGFLFVAERNLP